MQAEHYRDDRWLDPRELLILSTEDPASMLRLRGRRLTEADNLHEVADWYAGKYVEEIVDLLAMCGVCLTQSGRSSATHQPVSPLIVPPLSARTSTVPGGYLSSSAISSRFPVSEQ